MTVAHIETPVAEPPEVEGEQESPNAQGSERQMLACVLYVAQTDVDAAHALVDELSGVVEPRDMWHSGFFRVWQAMVDATAGGEPLDLPALSRRVQGDGFPAPGAVISLLPGLLDSSVTPASARWHAAQVAKAALQRRLQQAGVSITQRATSATFDAEHDLPAAQALLDKAAGVTAAGSSRVLADVLPDVVDLVEHPENTTGIPTGLDDLDLIYPGMAPGQLIVIGARPAVGKSTFALTLARNAAIRLGEPTLVCSLEMSTTEVVQRLIAADATVDLGRVLRGQCDEDDWNRISTSLHRLRAAPLFIDDSPGVTLGALRAKIRAHARRGLRLVVVDYLQLMATGKSENRQTAINEITRGLKILAKEAQVPIVLLSQLNRDLEKRSDKRPTLADLRESGGIENDADVVLLLHREEMHSHGGDLKRAGECDVIIAKHRNGKTATIPVAWQGHYARAVSMHNWTHR